MSNVPLIHPTAIIDPLAKIAPDVRIGAYSIVEGPVTIGPGCVLQSQVKLCGPLTLGARNKVHSFAVLGDWPQDRKFDDTFSETVIGDDNVFREYVTIHRATGKDTRTVIGSRNYFMVSAHVGHNCVVGNDVTLVNGSMLAGHVQISDRAIIGGNSAIHQFCRVGRLAMISGISAQSVDIPPFCISMDTNIIVQLNAVGLRRSGMPKTSLDGLRRMFQHVFRQHHMLKTAMATLPADLLAIPEVREFVDFCQTSKRGVARFQPWSDRGQSVEPVEAEDFQKEKAI